MSTGRSLLSQASLIFTGKSAGFILAFWIPIILVRLLSPEEFGAYKQFFLVGMTLISVLPLGLEASLFYFMPGDRARAATYFRQTALVLFVTGGLAGILVMAFRSGLATSLNAPALVDLAPLLAVYVLFEMGGQLLNLTVVIEQQARLAGVLFFAFDALRAVALVVPVYLTGDVYWLAAGAAGYAVVRSLVLAVWGWWTFRGTVASRAVDPTLLADQFRYALPFGASGLLDNGLQRFHQFFVSASFTPAAFATYSVGLQELAPVRLFFTSLFDVVLVRMREHFRDDRLDEVRRLWRRLLAGQAVLVVPLFVILWILAPAFIGGLFTDRYLDAVPVFRVALFVLLLTMVNDHAVLRSCAMTGFIFKATVAGLIASVAAVPVLVHTFGLPGGAAGFVLGLAVAKFMGVMKISRRIDMRFLDCIPWGTMARYAGAALVAALVTHPSRLLVDGALATFLLTGGLFWVVYGLIVRYGGLLPPEDQELLGRAIAPLARILGRA